MTSYAAFQKRLGISFNNPKMLEKALTHSSTGAEKNYERLEFVGDRVVGLVIAQKLFEDFPGEAEGDLAKRHAALVQGQTIAGIARTVGLGEVIQLSDAERAAGGADNDNILADGLEAVIGAIFLDSGLEVCARLIERLWADIIHTMKEPPQDPKTALQEWAQARGLALPGYETVSRDGPDHAPRFEVRVKVGGFEAVTATAGSRRAAEKEAAALLLSLLLESGK